jgi:exopolysaccharide biosynthesis protein
MTISHSNIISKAGFITGENICVDGGMSKQMIYNGDFGWSLS